MTLEQIAAALGLNEKTVDRDSKSIAESFRAGGIELATLNTAEVQFVAALIVVELEKKCPQSSGPGSSADRAPHVDSPSKPEHPGSAGRRAVVPRRFKP
ncbi:MAG: hypothetical protein ABI467_11335 [Kofleriaceae bacterium]